MTHTGERQPPPPTDAEADSPASEEAPSGDLLEGEDNERDPGLVRWNLGALLLDVSCFSIALAFLDLSAVLPLLLKRLGASDPFIGAFAAVRFLAFSCLQIFVAYAMHNRLRQKPALAFFVTTTRLPLLALPFFLWRAADSSAAHALALQATVLILAFWALGDGLGYVPWMEIVARTFSDRERGRFYATTQLLSGITTIGIAALVVRNILNAPSLPFPKNYAVLAALAAITFHLSTLGVLLIREPKPPRRPRPPRAPLFDYVRRLPLLIRDNPVFARLACIQLLIGFGSASSSFYVLHATERFHLGDAWGGTYQVFLAIGVVLLMPLWTYLSERFGPEAAVRGVALACLLTPVWAVSLGALSPWLFGFVLLLMGGSLGWGMWIALNHFLLTHIAEDERPLFVALMSLLFTPSAAYPYLGGLIMQYKPFGMGASFLFLLTASVIGVGFLLTLRLPAPEAKK